MDQSLELANDFYELGFWGIDELGDAILIPRHKESSSWRKLTNHAFKYVVGLGFSYFGSELPIPLGVWMHEEFHRAALGVKDIAAKNGNWLFTRWDGTVFGVPDSTLDLMKSENLHQLLYSYTAGVQSEVLLNQKVTIQDFYKQRSHYKNALLLYNAYYVFNYFRFSTSAASDSVKVIAPEHESSNPVERDYAGADLTSWAYDMFNPELPFTSRDGFPEGEGVNRRVGFSDLSPDAQSYLKKQRNLSWLNFINPAIFFLNRIRINPDLSFNVFTQYVPTHFGNDIALFLPVKYKQFDLLLGIHNYNNYHVSGYGFDLGLFNYRINGKLEADLVMNVWNQPEDFFNETKIFGGGAELSARYAFSRDFTANVSLGGKTAGWALGNPYLDDNVSFQMGINYALKN